MLSSHTTKRVAVVAIAVCLRCICVVQPVATMPTTDLMNLVMQKQLQEQKQRQVQHQQPMMMVTPDR